MAGAVGADTPAVHGRDGDQAQQVPGNDNTDTDAVIRRTKKILTDALQQQHPLAQPIFNTVIACMSINQYAVVQNDSDAPTPEWCIDTDNMLRPRVESDCKWGHG